MPTLKQYQERLAPFDIYNQTKVDLYTYSGLFLLRGYERIVIGKRGPYVECKSNQIKMNVIEVPENQHWRFYNKNAFYLEYRTNDEAYVKLYKQLKEVDYADYQIGYWYISPFDLWYFKKSKNLFNVDRESFEPMIVPCRKKRK